MVNGILWFDDAGPLAARIKRGAEAYEYKNAGQKPQCALVNTTEHRVAGLDNVDGVELRPSNLVLPGNYLIGVDAPEEG